jgi:aspartate/methionine/tyrosine aminotransferase
MKYDKEHVYDTQIAPLMQKIIEICKEEQIPMVCDFQYADTDEDGASFCTSIIPFPHQHDRMRRLAAIAHERHRVYAFTITTAPGEKN